MTNTSGMVTNHAFSERKNSALMLEGGAVVSGSARVKGNGRKRRRGGEKLDSRRPGGGAGSILLRGSQGR